MGKDALERMSQMRWQVRRFLRFGEDAAKSAGVTALQYYMMLHTQGFPGRTWASIGELAQRLQTAPHGVVALVSRCEQLGLVVRRDNADDGRMVEVHLTAKGRRVVDKVARMNQAQLDTLAAVIDAARASP